MADIQIFDDKAALVSGTADLILAAIQETLATQERFSFVLSGGSTPRPIYELLASEEYSVQIDWAKVFIFFGDERTVAPDHEDSNYRMAKVTLFDHVDIPEAQIFRMRGEANPHQAAMEYDQAVRQYFSLQPAAFDLILLGMGDDGHTASLFPETSVLSEETHYVAANFVEKLDTWRLTMTAPLINQGKRIVFLVGGENKATCLQQVLYGDRNPNALPSQLIDATHWLVDRAAASKLKE